MMFDYLGWDLLMTHKVKIISPLGQSRKLFRVVDIFFIIKEPRNEKDFQVPEHSYR